MRLRLAWVLFALGVIVAGCGGGGKAAFVPSTGGNANSGGNAPSSAKTTRANIALYVPPANKQASSRKPFYISSNTQAFGVVVVPYPSTIPSPLPTTNLQLFPVTTPSPCAVASGGGETCNFTVTAPIGTDLFIVAAFATAAPTGNTTPLSAFVSGPVTVSLSPAPGATPLAFTLDGVVYSVAVTVASPDPGNTPNTQVFTVGVPTSAPLGIAAYDTSGNLVMSDPTTPYYNPIVIEASPAGDGLTLSLVGSSPCGSSASGATAAIACAGDLSNVKVSYDGTPRPDANDHQIDNYSVFSTTEPNPSPSPANYVLASNIESYPLVTGGGQVFSGYLGREASGQFWFASYIGSGWITGTFDPATATAGAQGSLPSTSSTSNSFVVAPNGNLWVNDNGPIDCFSSIAGGTAVVSGLYPWTAGGDPIYPTAITVDSTGNLWYVGYDNSGIAPPNMYAGYFSASASCTAPSPNPPIAQFTLNADQGDAGASIAPLPGGGIAYATGTLYGDGIFIITTASGPTISAVPAVASPQPITGGVAVDPAGNAYSAFTISGNSDVEMLPNGASAMSVLLSVAPTPNAAFPSPRPTGLDAFGPSGAADRLEYTDEDYQALTLVESVPASPMPILVSLPNSADVFQAAYSTKGGEYVLDMDASENLNIVRVIPTKTWSVPNISLNSACGTTALLTILERGDSGPFTISFPSSSITATQLPGADHDFWLTVPNTGASFSAMVTDTHGRQETFQVTSAPSSITCGLARRRLKTHHM
jgi:hypothetical protein